MKGSLVLGNTRRPESNNASTVKEHTRPLIQPHPQDAKRTLPTGNTKPAPDMNTPPATAQPHVAQVGRTPPEHRTNTPTPSTAQPPNSTPLGSPDDPPPIPMITNTQKATRTFPHHPLPPASLFTRKTPHTRLSHKIGTRRFLAPKGPVQDGRPDVVQGQPLGRNGGRMLVVAGESRYGLFLWGVLSHTLARLRLGYTNLKLKVEIAQAHSGRPQSE